jgi:uncharacterized SAM-binding protein YcdF (DUF218 family)
VKPANDKKIFGRRIKILSFFLLLFLLWIFLAPFLATGLIVEKPLEKTDAILVLGGSHTYLERTQKAAELYKKGTAAKIYLTDDGEQSGWSPGEQRNPWFVELAQKSLIANGVPAESIEILSPKVSGTIDEARLLAEKAGSANLKSILIVTSAYHTRRALATFERTFAENNLSTEIGISAAAPGIQTPASRFWWLSVFGWQIVAGEYVKSLGYWVYY